MAKKKKTDAKAGGDGGEGAPAKSGGGIVSKAALIIALGAASFATVFLLPRPEPAAVETAHGEAGEHGAEEAKLDLHVETAYFALNPLTISLQEDQRILKIGITLETLSGEEDYIDPSDPKIRDAFTGYLRALRAEQINDAAFMAQMRAQLLRRAQLILGADVVHGILITDFLVR